MLSLLFSIQLINSGGNRDFYSILSLRHDATEREIDRSFQKLSRKYHPDKNKGDSSAADKFTDINDAYGILKDSLKRRVYDLYGEAGVSVYESSSNEMNELLGLTSGGNDQTTEIVKRRGKTYRITFPVDLVDFYNSNHFDLFIERTVMCRCPTKGYFCAKCRGHPTMVENTTLSLFIEKGSEDGNVVVFKNAGDTTEMNGPGDIEVKVVSKPHPLFTRKGADLHMNIGLTLKEALIGFKKTFKNLDGSEFVVESNEPLGCGKTLTLKGKGLPVYLYPGEFGDIVVHTSLRWPKVLSESKREKISNILSKSV